MLLSTLNWSTRAKEILAKAGFDTIEKLVEQSPDDLTQYRHLGKKTLVEIRYRLGKIGLCLKGDKVFSLERCATNYGELVERKAALEVELEAINKQLLEIEEAREYEYQLRGTLDEDAIYSEWQCGNNFQEIAQKHLTNKKVIGDICWERLEIDCASGNPPIFPSKVERSFHCRFCGEIIVATYQSSPSYPTCSCCGKQSKHFFK
jgi:hypothetical protein